MRWKKRRESPLMLADSEDQEYMTTHQTGSQLARPNKKGGVKWVSTPHVGRNDNVSLPSLCGILPPIRRGTLATHRGVASYPPSIRKKNQD